MRWLLAFWLLLPGMAALAQVGAQPACEGCLLDPGFAPLPRLEVCELIACPSFAPPSPAWTAGRMQDPNHGGYASVSSTDSAESLILTCESRGPMALGLRSGRFDRGEVQLHIDGAGVEWLLLQQRAGLLVAEIPRASRLIAALEDGEAVEVIASDGRTTARFGLRGSARAIAAAMAYCMER